MKKRLAVSVVVALVGIGFALATEKPVVGDTFITVRCDAVPSDQVYRIVKTMSGVKYINERGRTLDRIPDYCWPLTAPRSKE